MPLHQVGDSEDSGFDTAPRQGETPDARFDSLKNSTFRVKSERITSLHSRQNNAGRNVCVKKILYKRHGHLDAAEIASKRGARFHFDAMSLRNGVASR
ncbi:hypothetical protein M514_28146 [Trichuris suis]|uniref:Uncharacterized protein n=1 Tax=Trichuris suis TaxID=68888 RepID=A0A085MR29_9BILA|nr:hypothetical protein M514_28146 [Trichuris suis]